MEIKKQLLNTTEKEDPIILTIINNNPNITVTEFSFSTLLLEESPDYSSRVYYISTVDTYNFTCTYGETITYTLRNINGIYLGKNLNEWSTCAGGTNTNSSIELTGFESILDINNFNAVDNFILLTHSPIITINNYSGPAQPCPF